MRLRERDIESDAEGLAHEDLDLAGVCYRFDALLREHIPFIAAAWSTHDPATGLFTSCTLTGIEEDREREARLFENEFLEDEPASCLSMIAKHETVATLSEATHGNLERAARYRNVFKAFGVSDELRAILWADDRAWGGVSLYRVDGCTFTREDAAVAAVVAPIAGRAMQLALLRTAALRPRTLADPPGILQAGPSGSVTALTEPGRAWLALGGSKLVTAVNVTAAAVRRHRDWPAASSRLILPDGRVLSLQAASMTPDGDGVAVIVHFARPVEVGAMLVDAYGLSRRQREVLGRLLLGRSMTEIARELGISEHTANDYRKAIYLRFGVSSRSELAGLLQFEEYSPRSNEGVPPSPYGGFLGK